MAIKIHLVTRQDFPDKVLRFFLVGSSLEKEDPRDYDLMGVMEDDHFRGVFGMDGPEFLRQKKSGDWSKDMWKWKEQTIGAIRILQAIMPEKVPIDFKFIPESLLLEPNVELILRVHEENPDGAELPCLP